MKKSLIVYFFVIPFYLIGCGVQTNYICYSTTPTPPGPSSESYPMSSNSLKLIQPEAIESFYIGDFITLIVENQSDYEVWIPSGYNHQMYIIITQNQLQHIDDSLERSIEDPRLLGPQGSETSTTVILLKPIIENKGKEVNILITIYGNGYRNGMYCEDNHVGYIELTLQP